MSEGQPYPGAPAARLAATARWIAAARAAETGRPDRLLEDPWAAALAGPEGEDWLGARAGSPALAVMIIRARFFDDFLRRVTVPGGAGQVVLLGAGLDTRGYRLAWSGRVQMFELDQPEVPVRLRLGPPSCMVPVGASVQVSASSQLTAVAVGGHHGAGHNGE